LFSEYQNALAERTTAVLKTAGAFYSNNYEFLKRVMNENTKREWIEAVAPLLDQLFIALEEFIAAVRDGTMRSTGPMSTLLSPLEKTIGSIISKWGRLNEKGHGQEVDKMGSNLEAFESATHRLENLVVKFIADFQAKIQQEQEEKQKQQEQIQQLQLQQQQQIQQINQQQLNQQGQQGQQGQEQIIQTQPSQPPPPSSNLDILQQLDDIEVDSSNLSDLDKEIRKLSNQYGDKIYNEDDPNATILNALLDLSKI